MELLIAAPIMLGVFKIVGAAIAFAMAIPFIIGLVLGYMIGHR